MYIVKDTTKMAILNQSQLAREVGVNQSTLNRIFRRKQKCSKLMAYAIVKTINQNAEIEDYFEREK